MKRIYILLAAAAVLVSCSEIKIEDNSIKVTTSFEDNSGLQYWSKLIDNPQYGGSLISSGNTYAWTSASISHEMIKSEYSGTYYWSSGAAISNYVENGEAGYNKQLAVRGTEGKGGHNGSANFAVWMGHDWGYGAEMASFTLVGADELVEMYVTNTAYALSYCYDGEGECAIENDQYVKIILTATTADDKKVTSEFTLVDGPDKIVKEWTKWDLSNLGKIKSFTFNVDGNIANANGFLFPAYFAFDDIVTKADLLAE